MPRVGSRLAASEHALAMLADNARPPGLALGGMVQPRRRLADGFAPVPKNNLRMILALPIGQVATP
jgi:hypothetical protein